MSKHHEHLLKLELDGAEITDAAIRNISTCKKLQSLEISFCEYLSDDSLLFLKVSHSPKYQGRYGKTFCSIKYELLTFKAPIKTKSSAFVFC